MFGNGCFTPAILLLDIQGLNAKNKESTIADIVPSDTVSAQENNNSIMGDFIKRMFMGAVVDLTLINKSKLSGEVVLNSEKIIGIKRGNNIYYINPNEIVSCI